MRLIDADALKEAIRKRLCISSLKYLTEQEKVIVEEIDNAPTVEPEKIAVANVTFDKEQLEEIVEKAKAEVLAVALDANEKPQGEWTPVSERLPEENGEYLVTREAYIDRENRNMVFVRDIASFTINHGLNNGFHKANTVIAWQPLPEPYKKGGAK